MAGVVLPQRAAGEVLVVLDAAVLAGGWSEGFDSLPAADFDWVQGGTLPGWSAASGAGGGALNLSARAEDGTSNLRDLTLASVGGPVDGERALVFHTRVAAVPTYLGLGFSNDSGHELAGFRVAYAAEQWREATDNRSVELEVQFRVGAEADDLAVETGWSDVPGTSATTSGGSAPAATELESGLVEVHVPESGTLWLRWRTTNTADSPTASHDILAVDDVRVTFEFDAEPSAPEVTLHPSSQQVVEGDTVTFTAAASGNPKPSLQWTRDGSPVEGATAEVFEIGAAVLADAGGYAVVAANELGTVSSAVATLTVTPRPQPPVVTAGPADSGVVLGAMLELSVAVSGTGPFEFQWTKDGEPIEGATSPTYTVAQVAAGDAGDYRVEVGNLGGSVSSQKATVTVLFPPGATLSHSHPAVVAGGEVNLEVAVTGTPPFEYQWRKDGADLAGETGPVLALSGLAVGDGGRYDVVVTNAAGTTTAEPVDVAVFADPVAPVITGQPIGFSAAAETSAELSVGFTATAPFEIRWFRDGAEIAGESTATLTFAPLVEDDAGEYTVTVTNAAGNATSAAAAVAVTPSGLRDYFVAPDGRAADPGTIEAPTTLARAVRLVEPGFTVFLRGGTYRLGAQVTIERSNAGSGEALRKHLFAYTAPGGAEERPVLDFSSQPYGRTSDGPNPRGIQINGHWWHLRGLEVAGAADNGVYVAGDHNVIERCTTRHNRDTGIQIGRYASSADRSEWPSYNLVLNCDSHDNYDGPPNQGENADGFAAKLTSGPGNVFRGCIARNNIDDGWDLYTKSDTGPIFPVVIDRCIAYHNGTLSDGFQNSSGDRNGFKLGGEKIDVVHYVTRNIAFANGKNGFTFNSNPGAIRVINNLAFDNVRGNFKFDDPTPLFYNNASLYTADVGENDRYGGSSGIATGPSNCFWFVGSSARGPSINDLGIEVSPASFVSLEVPDGGFARLPDGSPDLGGFALPAAGGALPDAGEFPPPGILVELPFDVAAHYQGLPDIGAVETGSDAPPAGGAELLVYALGARAGTAGQPEVDVWDNRDGTVSLQFNRLRADLVYTVERSGDLWNWVPLAVDPGVAGEKVEVIDPVPAGAYGERFLRVRVSAR